MTGLFLYAIFFFFILRSFWQENRSNAKVNITMHIYANFIHNYLCAFQMIQVLIKNHHQIDLFREATVSDQTYEIIFQKRKRTSRRKHSLQGRYGNSKRNHIHIHLLSATMVSATITR